jgi:hypothetical protein
MTDMREEISLSDLGLCGMMVFEGCSCELSGC